MYAKVLILIKRGIVWYPTSPPYINTNIDTTQTPKFRFERIILSRSTVSQKGNYMVKIYDTIYKGVEFSRTPSKLVNLSNRRKSTIMEAKNV